MEREEEGKYHQLYWISGEHEGAAWLRMARTMDERCLILRDQFKANSEEYVKRYKGHALLNSWETRR